VKPAVRNNAITRVLIKPHNFQLSSKPAKMAEK